MFCNRKREVAQLHRSLVRHGFSAVALHGDMDQPARTAALDQFRRGEIALLIASDVAARGLDIPAVSHVFNFDVPHHADDYVHRIGRTGRAGRTGTAITVVSPSDHKNVAAIEKLIGQTIQLDERAAVPPFSAEPRPVPRLPRTATAASPRVITTGQPQSHVSKTRGLAGVPTAAAHQPDHAAGAGHLPAFLLRPVRLKA